MLLAGGGAALAEGAPATSAGAEPAGAGAARAPMAVSEVIVTATKRAEDVQRVPFTVTALGAADLNARGAKTIDQAISFVPGLAYTSNGANSGAYTIRGVNTSTFIAGTQSPVALYIDDISILDPFYPKVTPNLRLFDVSRVEVLEGPQGTLFGSGALGGAVRVITNRPNLTDYQAEAQGTVSGTRGGGASYDLNAMVNLPLVKDVLALRLVGYYDHEGGWIDNTARGERQVNHSLSQGGRVELSWAPNQDLRIIGSAMFETGRPHDSAYSYYTDHRLQWNGLVPNTNYDRTRIYSVTGTYDLHWASLTSITTYADRFEYALADFSFDSQKFLGLFTPSPVPDIGPSRTFSQEVRLASPDTGPFRWLFGAIYINNRRRVLEPLTIPGSGALFGVGSDLASLSDERVRIREEALFGEVSYDLTPQLTATVGLRAFRNELNKHQEIGGTLNPPSTNDSKVTESSATPKFNLSYRLAPRVMIYAQVAEGYRIGQTNPVLQDPISHEPIPAASTPDKLWNYELGAKSTLFDGRVVANASVYFIDWTNIQLNEVTAASGINFIGNAGTAHVKGFELAVRAQATKALQVGGSVSYNDARLVRVNPAVSATQGDQLPGSSPWQIVAFAEYVQPLQGDLTATYRVDGRWVGRAYANLINSTSLTYGDYATVNLRAGLNWRRYSVSVFADNLLNDDGKVAAISALGFQAAIRQRPRTAGVTLDAKF